MVMAKRDRIIEEAEKYYTRKVLEYGEGPQASDWNSVNAQEIRFSQISKVLPEDPNQKSFIFILWI